MHSQPENFVTSSITGCSMPELSKELNDGWSPYANVVTTSKGFYYSILIIKRKT